MGKKHASQYANFGSLLLDGRQQAPVKKESTNLTITIYIFTLTPTTEPPNIELHPYDSVNSLFDNHPKPPCNVYNKVWTHRYM